MKVHEFLSLVGATMFKVDVTSTKSDEFTEVNYHHSKLNFIDVVDLTLPENHVKETMKAVRVNRDELLNKYGDYELFKWHGTNLKVQVIVEDDKKISIVHARPVIVIYLPGAWNPNRAFDGDLH